MIHVVYQKAEQTELYFMYMSHPRAHTERSQVSPAVLKAKLVTMCLQLN